VDINATLIGQMITFAIFVWFTMQYIWPIMENILKQRYEKIAEGLAAAERGHKELEVARKIHHGLEARNAAQEALEQAKRSAAAIVDQAKAEALQEREQILALAQQEIELERRKLKTELLNEVSTLVMASTEKLLGRVLTESDQKALLKLNE
jgi:F-type H+-transporting ATPase subunit b